MTFVIALMDQCKGVTKSGVMELKTRGKRGMAGDWFSRLGTF